MELPITLHDAFPIFQGALSNQGRILKKNQRENFFDADRTPCIVISIANLIH